MYMIQSITISRSIIIDFKELHTSDTRYQFNGDFAEH